MADVARARQLVLEHGWNATAYQIVNRGIEHWFSVRGDCRASGRLPRDAGVLSRF